MSEFVCQGAMMTCTFGLTQASLTVTSQDDVLSGGLPLATVTDFAPFENISPFGVCTSLANPAVAEATAAANGVLTPAPCIPNIGLPWTPGSSDVMLGGSAGLLDDDTCACVWGGEISIASPGQGIVSGSG